MNHYQILGVPPNASPADIKSAYRKRSRKAHPDKGGDHAEMAALNKAYEVLGDPERREQYDKTGSDAKVASLDELARQLLLFLFSQALEKRGFKKTNWVSLVRRSLQQGIRDGNGKIKQLKSELASLKENMKEVEVEEGEFNAFAAICEQRVESMECNLANMEMERDKGKRALELLEKYKCGVIEDVERNPFGADYYSSTSSRW